MRTEQRGRPAVRVLALVALLLGGGLVAAASPVAAAGAGADLSAHYPGQDTGLSSTQTIPAASDPIFTVEVENRGPEAATKVVVRIQASPGLVYWTARQDVTDPGDYPYNYTCTVAGGDIACEIPGTLPASDSSTHGQLRVFFYRPAMGTYSLTATVSSEVEDPNPTNNSTAVTWLVEGASAQSFGEQTIGLESSGPQPVASSNTWDRYRDDYTSVDEAFVAPGDTGWTGLTMSTSVGAYGGVHARANVNLSMVRVAPYIGGYGQAGLGTLIQADSVRGACSSTTSGQAGSATFQSLYVGGVWIPGVPVPGGDEYAGVTVPPNTQVTIPAAAGKFAKVTLNEQQITGRTISVNAIHVHVYDSLTRTLVRDIIVGHAQCSVTYY
jgi:hypothetical protein